MPFAIHNIKERRIMKEINDKTTDILADVMRDQESASTIFTRMIIIKLSLLNDKNIDLVYALLRPIIKACFSDPEGKILRFPDEDVVIISKLATQKTYDVFFDALSKLSLADMRAEGLCGLYELPADAAIVKQFMIDKASAEALPPAVIPPKSALKPNLFVELPIAPNMKASIPLRRKSRAETVIQIVEDDAFSQRVAHNLLSDKHIVVSSYTGQQAISFFVTHAPDIVFLDIGLPDINGQKLLERLLQIDPSAHIVMLSGHGSRENVMQAIKAGAKGFIAKPFTAQKLAEAIANSSHIQAKDKK